MKRAAIAAALLLGIGLTAGRAFSQLQVETKPELSAQDKRLTAEIAQQQRIIDRLDREIGVRQVHIEKLKTLLSESKTLSYTKPRVTIILNISETVAIVNSGISDGLYQGDTFFVMRRGVDRMTLVAKGIVQRSFSKDAECEITENPGGFRPEDEIYVVNRSSSPLGIKGLVLPKQAR